MRADDAVVSSRLPVSCNSPGDWRGISAYYSFVLSHLCDNNRRACDRFNARQCHDEVSHISHFMSPTMMYSTSRTAVQLIIYIHSSDGSVSYPLSC